MNETDYIKVSNKCHLVIAFESMMMVTPGYGDVDRKEYEDITRMLFSMKDQCLDNIKIED